MSDTFIAAADEVGHGPSVSSFISFAGTSYGPEWSMSGKRIHQILLTVLFREHCEKARYSQVVRRISLFLVTEGRYWSDVSGAQPFKEGVLRRAYYKDGLASVSLGIPEGAQAMPFESFKEYFSVLIENGIRSLLVFLKKKKVEINEALLLNDLGRALDDYRSIKDEPTMHPGDRVVTNFVKRLGS